MHPVEVIPPEEFHRHLDKVRRYFPNHKLPTRKDLRLNPVLSYMMTRRFQSIYGVPHDLRMITELLTSSPVNPFEYPWWTLTYESAVSVKVAARRRYSVSKAARRAGISSTATSRSARAISISCPWP